MPHELIPDAGGDPRNAVALALASQLAYWPEDQAVPAFRDNFGMTAKLFSRDNTQAYVATNDNAIIVAFRGSQAPTSIDGLKDWLLTDAVNLLIVPEGHLGTDFMAAGVGCRFHKGFMGALAEIWDPLFAEVEGQMKAKERPLWVCGHSLGGALALLAAWRFQRRFVPVHQIYTYGGPMIGNSAAKAAFDKEFAGQIFRYANATDPVPKLPTVSLVANDYAHVDKEMALTDGSASPLDFAKELAGKIADGVLNANLRDELWEYVKQRIHAHDITKYQGMIGQG